MARKEMTYAVYVANAGDYSRTFGANKIELKNRIARPIEGEVIGILRHTKDVVIFNGIDNSVISFDKEEL